MKVKHVPWAFALLLLFQSTVAEHTRELVLATYAYAKFDRHAALEPLAAHLAEHLNRPVKVQLAKSPSALVEALSAGEIDIAVTNTFTWLAATNIGLPVVGVAVLDVPAERADTYRGALVARLSGGLDSAADVARQASELTIALVVPGSTSGALVQGVQLAAHGLNNWPDEFKAVLYAGTHEAAIEAVRTGTADVAAMADAVWQRTIGESPEQVEDVHRIWRSAPIAVGPVACRVASNIPCADVQALMLSLHVDNHLAFAAIQNAWPETAGAKRFVTVPNESYAELSGGPDAAVSRAFWIRLLGSE